MENERKRWRKKRRGKARTYLDFAWRDAELGSDRFAQLGGWKVGLLR